MRARARLAGGPDRVVPRSARVARPALQRRRHASRASARIAEARRAEREIAAGHYRGPLHGIPYGAKDLLATAGGIPTTLGRGAVPRPALRRRRHRDPKARGGGRRPRAPSSPWWSWRAAWAIASPTPRSPGRASTRGTRRVERRLVERLGLGRRGRARAVRDRLGDMGLDPLAGRLLRRVRAPPDLRPGQPPRRDGALLDPRQARAARAHRRRLRARPRGHRGPRSRGPDHQRPRADATTPRTAPDGGSGSASSERRDAPAASRRCAANFEQSLGVLRAIGTVEEVAAARPALGGHHADHPLRRGGQRLRGAGRERRHRRADGARGPLRGPTRGTPSSPRTT